MDKFTYAQTIKAEKDPATKRALQREFESHLTYEKACADQHKTNIDYVKAMGVLSKAIVRLADALNKVAAKR